MITKPTLDIMRQIARELVVFSGGRAIVHQNVHLAIDIERFCTLLTQNNGSDNLYLRSFSSIGTIEFVH